MSIPSTVSRVLKYIPELQQQVQALTKRKEELLCRISRQLQGDAVKKESHRKISHHNSSFVVSTTRLNDCEAVVHISSQETHKAPLSEILQCLENDGLFLLDASSSQTFGGRFFYNLHFQVSFIYNIPIYDYFRSSKIILTISFLIIPFLSYLSRKKRRHESKTEKGH